MGLGKKDVEDGDGDEISGNGGGGEEWTGKTNCGVDGKVADVEGDEGMCFGELLCTIGDH